MASEKERLEGVAEWYTNREGFMARLVEMGYEEMRPHFRGERALEVGAADGRMTDLLRKSFKDLTVVEGSSAFAAKLRERFPDVTVVDALVEEWETDARFDTIIASHLIEHVDDPQSVLESLKSRLAPGGVLVSLVPNAHSFHRQLGVKMGLLQTENELNELDVRLGHRRVYRPHEFREELKRAGFRIVHFGGVLFKILSNGQMEEVFSDEQVRGLQALGRDHPENACDMFCVCELP